MNLLSGSNISIPSFKSSLTRKIDKLFHPYHVMEQKGCIYLVTCLINGKKYVGQHNTIDALKRWDTHCRSKRSSSTILHNAIRLYGKENFKIEILCICLHAALGQMEAYYAEQYGSYIWDHEPGYNMVWCGNQPMLGVKHSLEAIQKIKEAQRGKKRSLEAIEKTKQANIGKKRSSEACENIGKSKRGHIKSQQTIEKLRQSLLLYHAKKREAFSNSQASQLVFEDD